MTHRNLKTKNIFIARVDYQWNSLGAKRWVKWWADPGQGPKLRPLGSLFDKNATVGKDNTTTIWSYQRGFCRNYSALQPDALDLENREKITLFVLKKKTF